MLDRRRRFGLPPIATAAIMCLAMHLGALPTQTRAQSEPAPAEVSPPGEPPAASNPVATLTQRQAGVAERYNKLEELLLRLADMESDENPERAALLRRAASQSRDTFVLQKLRGASEALRSEQFQNAVQRQAEAADGLESLLTLLLSEDRSKRIRDEKERVARMIKDLKRIERAQRSTRARTENGAEFKELEGEQQAITERAQELNAELADEPSEPAQNPSESPDSPQGEPSAESPSDSPMPSDRQPPAGDKAPAGAPEDPGDDGKPENDPGEPKTPQQPAEAKPATPDKQPPGSESKPGQSPAGQPPEGEPQPSESQPSESQPSESQPSKSAPSESKPGQPQQSPPSQGSPPPEGSDAQPSEGAPQSPQQEAEEKLRQAVEKMREAEEQLEQAKRSEATEQQRQAEENLREAIDRLERILRQLREEEMQRELAKLESRLRKMAAMQSKVLDDTVALAATPESQRNRQTDLKAGELAFEEKKITLEADRAMLLLREEGSSVAFPEVVDQIRSDTASVAERLAETKLDDVTQGIQKDILAALEEMIAALQKAQRDLEQKKQEQQSGEPSSQGEGDQPLVEALAELRLIRTMETRIKSTTERYAGLIEAGETTGDDVLPLLQNLAERQNRLYRITRDLVLKRNQ